MSKRDVCELGGKCPNCGCEDQWVILDRLKINGTEFDYSYSLECFSQDAEHGFCNYQTEIQTCEEPEYEVELTREFMDE